MVGVKMTGSGFTYARPETTVYGRALLIVAGRAHDIERFAAAT